MTLYEKMNWGGEQISTSIDLMHLLHGRSDLFSDRPPVRVERRTRGKGRGSSLHRPQATEIKETQLW